MLRPLQWRPPVNTKIRDGKDIYSKNAIASLENEFVNWKKNETIRHHFVVRVTVSGLQQENKTHASDLFISSKVAAGSLGILVESDFERKYS